MKKAISTIALTLGLLISATSYAQTQKIGHINADLLLEAMPETAQVQKEIEAYRTQLQKDLKEMETELETKYNAYVANEKMMTQLSKETKQREIQELQGRIQEYQQRASQDLQNKQVELITPIIEKATKAVSDVAKENGFTYILDSSESKAVVVFVDNGIDIMPLVKKKLGIQ
jgi:outer membrane protein